MEECCQLSRKCYQLSGHKVSLVNVYIEHSYNKVDLILFINLMKYTYENICTSKNKEHVSHINMQNQESRKVNKNNNYKVPK